jgi:hypothetical protein
MPGIATSLIVIAVGAILEFATTVSPYQHGFNIHTAGLILIIIGAVGLVMSLVVFGVGGSGRFAAKRHQTTVDDGQGHVVRREDTYQ